MKPLLVALTVLAFAGVTTARAAETKPMETKTEYAVLGGGCFWCMQAVFDRVPGVTSVTCGYAGGHTANPTYEEVCTDTTGHAEVVRIGFDPAKTSYTHLLAVFWASHDPTTLDRQGPDTGTQYRSIILYENEAQKAAAEKSMAEAQAAFSKPIVTQIVPLKKFWPAEAYHQDYFAKHPDRAYCALVIQPKVAKLEAEGVIETK